MHLVDFDYYSNSVTCLPFYIKKVEKCCESMKIIVSKNKDTWTGILLNEGKLFYSSYFYKSKEEAVSHLSKIANEDVEVEERNHPLIDAIKGIANGT